jgi:hypothetical protein
LSGCWPDEDNEEKEADKAKGKGTKRNEKQSLMAAVVESTVRWSKDSMQGVRLVL